MRHRHHEPDVEDVDDYGAGDDDVTWALKAAFWLLGVIALGFLLGLYLLTRGR